MARGECEASLLSALAQLMCVLSRLAEDMILFSMPEFGYFKLPRAYCTGSSIMPQKFNPDVLELVRGKTAQVVGWQTAALTLLHAMPGGYNRDLQDAKLLYMKGLDTTRTTLRILAKVAKGMEIDPAACRAAFTPGVFATDAALRQGLRLEVTPSAKLRLIEKGTDEKYGARPLRRAIERLLENDLAELLLAGAFKAGDTISVRKGKAEDKLDFVKKEKPAGRRREVISHGQ